MNNIYKSDKVISSSLSDKVCDDFNDFYMAKALSLKKTTSEGSERKMTSNASDSKSLKDSSHLSWSSLGKRF